MISVQAAKKIVLEHASPLSTEQLAPVEASGRVIAETIISPSSLPPFDQSVMDGFAVSGSQETFKLKGEIKAGDSAEIILQNGEAIRIYTGAMIPEGTTAVVMQEHCSLSGDALNILQAFTYGDFIRKKGSQVQCGAILLPKGSMLNAGSAGFLASAGITEATVYTLPRVALLITGNEIAKPGTSLRDAQVHESNSVSLMVALKQTGISPVNVLYATDEVYVLTEKVSIALEQADVIIITGGISVGKYDLVKETLSALEVKEHFYKVLQKPGKPLYFGSRGNQIVFALPGNPASALICFYEYVYPAIRRICGFTEADLISVRLPLLSDISKKEERAWFMRAKADNNGVNAHSKQDSNSLASFAEANAILYLPDGIREYHKGDLAEVHLLPQ